MFKLITDSTADLPMEYLEAHDVGCLPISYILDGVTYGREKQLDWKEFYACMREEGKMPTTSQINPAEAGQSNQSLQNIRRSCWRNIYRQGERRKSSIWRSLPA